MKQIGPRIISTGIVFVCLLAFQNCGGTGSSSNLASNAANSSLVNNCQAGSSASCPIANGIGSLICGSSTSSCSPTSCNSGFVINGNSCVTATCTPLNSQSCSPPNGSGTQTCSAQGAWGSCQVTSCTNGYTLAGGVCVQNTLPSSVTIYDTFCSAGTPYGNQSLSPAVPQGCYDPQSSVGLYLYSQSPGSGTAIYECGDTPFDELFPGGCPAGSTNYGIVGYISNVQLSNSVPVYNWHEPAAFKNPPFSELTLSTTFGGYTSCVPSNSNCSQIGWVPAN